MMIYYNAQDRKPLVKAISEFTGADAIYLRTPTYAYLYSYANIIKTDGLTLPLYILPFYPYSSSNQHYLGFALGICKLCLTTINNLSEPVRKLDGQVMKITYDIVDE